MGRLTHAAAVARFWAGVLGWELADDLDLGIALLPRDETGFRIRFLSTRETKAGQNQMHFDLTSTSLGDQRQTVARSLGLGAAHRHRSTSGGGSRGARRP